MEGIASGRWRESRWQTAAALIPQSLSCIQHNRPGSPPPTLADPKVLAFYRQLRERQLRALGLDPGQFQTLY